MVYTTPFSAEESWEVARGLSLLKVRGDLQAKEAAIAEIKRNPKDLRNQDIPKLEELIARIRRQLRRGDDALVMTNLADLERAWRASAYRVLKPAVELGQKFAPRGRGVNQLTKLIDRALHDLGGNASARDLHRYVLKIAPKAMIERVDADDSIEWLEGDKPRTLTFHSFQKRVSQRRKKISPR